MGLLYISFALRLGGGFLATCLVAIISKELRGTPTSMAHPKYQQFRVLLTDKNT